MNISPNSRNGVFGLISNFQQTTDLIFPPDDSCGGNFFSSNQTIRGPAVRGRAGGCTGTATSYNSGFTRRTLRVLGLRQPARRSLRLLKEEAQASCPSRRFVNPRAVIRHAVLLVFCTGGKRHRGNYPTPLDLGRGRNPHPSSPCYFGDMGEFIGSPTPGVLAIGSATRPRPV